MRKNHEIRVKVSKEELEIIQAKAKQLGMKASGFLRAIGLKANFIPS